MKADIYVVGGPKKKRHLVKEAVAFYAHEIRINVYLIKDLVGRDGVKADAVADDDNEDELPREFEIRLDSNMNIPAILRILAHEMVHVKQFATGEMVEVKASDEYVVWQGKRHTETSNNYWDVPWEIEANGKEYGLFERFLESRDYLGKRWNVDPDY
jgi:hypothetical protein